MTTDEIVERLSLAPHPEGGFYREVHRSAISTAIYFLLPRGACSRFHRIPQEEIWHHYDGDAVELALIDEGGALAMKRLDRDNPCVVIPPGVYQAAACVGNSYALCGCTVSPPFDFATFELPSQEELLARFPAHADVVKRFIAPGAANS